MNLTANKVESNLRLGPFIHAPGDGDEIIAIEKAMLEDEGVKAEIAKLKLPEGTVVVTDPWIYGQSTPAMPRSFSATQKYLTSSQAPMVSTRAPFPTTRV